MEHRHAFISRYISHEGAYFKYSGLTQGSRVCSSVRGGGGWGSPVGRFPGVGGRGLTGEGGGNGPVHRFLSFTKLLRLLYIRGCLHSVHQAVLMGVSHGL